MIDRAYRQWGYYDVIYRQDPSCVTKILTILPGKTTSLQRHFKRSELWFSHSDVIHFDIGSGVTTLHSRVIEPGQEAVIPRAFWHRVYNYTDKEVSFIEIQWGTECREDDIERHNGPI